MFKYKINVLKALSEKGFTTTRIRKEKILSEATMQNIRSGKSVTLETLNIVCVILRCQLSDIIEIEPTNEEKIKFF